MLTIHDLEQFAGATETRICDPWSDGEYTYATDQFVLVRVPRMAGIQDIKSYPEAVKVFEDNPKPSGPYVPLPTLAELGELETCPACLGKAPGVCPECAGSGEVRFENAYNTYESECETCGGGAVGCSKCYGAGRIEPNPRVYIGGMAFNTPYLRRFAKLPNARICINPDPSRPSWIEFDGGYALVMAMYVARLRGEL